MRTLARAAALGYRDHAAVDKESAFAALKQHPEFQTVLALLKLRARVDAAAKDPNKRAAMGALQYQLEPLSTEPLASLLVAETSRTIGDYLMRAGDTDVAQGDCHRALELLRGMATVTETADVTLAVETARTWQLQGQLHFRAQRYADAMSAWRSARAVLDSVREGRQDNETLKKAVAALEYEWAEAYGTLGAFGGAREHYDLGFAASTEIPEKDSHIALEHAAVLAHEHDATARRRLVNWMQTTCGETERSAIAECLAPTADTSGRNLVASMAKFVQGDPQNAWFQVGQGLAHLRRGAPALAVETFSQSAVTLWIPGDYHMALAFHAQGDLARAREHFEWGEARYRRALAKDVLLDTHPALPSNVQRTRLGGA